MHQQNALLEDTLDLLDAGMEDIPAFLWLYRLSDSYLVQLECNISSLILTASFSKNIIKEKNSKAFQINSRNILQELINSAEKF